jgi:hypothetical protein
VGTVPQLPDDVDAAAVLVLLCVLAAAPAVLVELLVELDEDELPQAATARTVMSTAPRRTNPMSFFSLLTSNPPSQDNPRAASVIGYLCARANA